VSIDLEDLYDFHERILYDLKTNLYQDLILREKEFRSFIKSFNWEEFKNKNVAITCTVDAIIPTWAYMLVISRIQPHARFVMIGNLDDLEKSLFQKSLEQLDMSKYKDARVVIKGCSDKPVPNYAYGELTRKLMPVVSSIMFGEPCSTVPVYKKPKKVNLGE
jgi:hypothetical protein